MKKYTVVVKCKSGKVFQFSEDYLKKIIKAKNIKFEKRIYVEPFIKAATIAVKGEEVDTITFK